jgi:hypothetical protein
MSDQSTISDHHALPAEVWSALTTELRARVIWLLAQLAFNLVMAQTEHNSQEVSNVTVTSQQSQDPA